MKKMLNFEKISHLYLQEKVDGFKKIIQECLEEEHLLKDGKLHPNDILPITEYDICLIETFNSIYPYMNYKDFCYISDGYCFSLSIGYNWLDKHNTTNIDVKKDNRENGIYVYLNKELKEVLLCSL